MKSTRIIFVGGFLGAGKTTLLWEAAQRLIKKDYRLGLITNDQAPELVDTALLSQNGLNVAEVSGSCFCCNFNGLTDAIKKVNVEAVADIIIAEPVGSCTDLSATILQPLKQNHGRELKVSPLTVLADPTRLIPVLDGETADLHQDAAYIFRKQLEEGDIILVGKSDLLSPEALSVLLDRTRKAFPFATVLAVSAVSGEGIDEWLDEVLKRTDAGSRIIEVDYDIYAHGEAVLGWLNGTILIKGESVQWDAFIKNLLADLGKRFDSAGYGVGHLKVILENGDQYIAGSLTGKSQMLSFRGSAGSGSQAKLTLNARVETSPENLETIVREALEASTSNYETKVVAWRCLQPGRPNPTFRFTQVVVAG
jgi:Ni2+-binding GTPase involved in maturation of urease and hydrogenase